MKHDLSIQETESDNASYSREINLCESILVQGFVLILLLTVIGIGIVLALTASFPRGKKEASTELVRPTGQMELPENSTNQLYVVQSGSIEIQP